MWSAVFIGWKTKQLNHGGRVVLIKHVLQAFPIIYYKILPLLPQYSSKLKYWWPSFFGDGKVIRRNIIRLPWRISTTLLMKKGWVWGTWKMCAYHSNIYNGGSLVLKTYYGENFTKPNAVKGKIPSAKNGILLTTSTGNIWYTTGIILSNTFNGSLT